MVAEPFSNCDKDIKYVNELSCVVVLLLLSSPSINNVLYRRTNLGFFLRLRYLKIFNWPSIFLLRWGNTTCFYHRGWNNNNDVMTNYWGIHHVKKVYPIQNRCILCLILFKLCTMYSVLCSSDPRIILRHKLGEIRMLRIIMP